MPEPDGPYYPPPPFPGFNSRDWHEDAEPEEEQVSGQPKTEKPETPPEPLRLTDDSLVVDVDGEAKSWRTIKGDRLRQADYTRKMQEFSATRKRYEPYEQLIKVLETVPAARNDIREVLNKRLGYGQAPQQEVSNEEFDNDPRAAVNKAIQQSSAALRAEIARQQQINPEQLKADIREDVILEETLEEFGDDRELVVERAWQKAQAMPAQERDIYDRDKRAMRKLLRGTYKEILQEREQHLGAPVVEKVNRAAPSPGGRAAATEIPKKDAWSDAWNVSDEEIQKTINKARSLA